MFEMNLKVSTEKKKNSFKSTAQMTHTKVNLAHVEVFPLPLEKPLKPSHVHDGRVHVRANISVRDMAENIQVTY